MKNSKREKEKEFVYRDDSTSPGSYDTSLAAAGLLRKGRKARGGTLACCPNTGDLIARYWSQVSALDSQSFAEFRKEKKKDEENKIERQSVAWKIIRTHFPSFFSSFLFVDLSQGSTANS